MCRQVSGDLSRARVPSHSPGGAPRRPCHLGVRRWDHDTVGRLLPTSRGAYRHTDVLHLQPVLAVGGTEARLFPRRHLPVLLHHPAIAHHRLLFAHRLPSLEP